MTSAPAISMSVANGLVASLDLWRPTSLVQDALRGEYAAFVREGGGSALDRDGGPEHVTASCFVLTPDLSHVLLCFHRKGRFWVQLGGHVEIRDTSVAEAALREAREEGGITDLVPWGVVPVDLDRHALGSRFGRCTVHWDVGFVACAPLDAVPVTSAESEDVAWWPTDALPEDVPPGFGDRLRTVLAEVAHVPPP